MQKKLIKRHVKTSIEYMGERLIEDVIQDLKKLQNEGCTHIENETFEDCTHFRFYYFSEESDQEYKNRIKQEKDTLKKY